MRKALFYAVIFILFLGLATLRYFQEVLFYDPLIEFFSGNYLYSEILPNLNLLKLSFFTSLRFWLNSILSIAILQLFFRESGILKITLLIYALLFLLLISGFVLLIFNYQESFELPLFYIRRFLIQPMLLLILLPAFYYQKLRNN